MGLINVKLQLANPKLPAIAPVEAEALIDTGGVHLVIPEHIRLQL